MKNTIKVLLMFVAAVIAGTPGPVKAGGPPTAIVNGRWAGSAFANPAFDLNADGVAARTFDVKTFDQVPFSGFEGVLDTELLALGCSGPASLLLRPLGSMTFRGRLGDALFAEVDPAAPDICFDFTNPNEVIQIILTGGTGIYQTATGNGSLTVHDVVRLSRPVTLPGFPPGLQAPTFIDTRGEFSLSIRW
jgi:hypothetical protein